MAGNPAVISSPQKDIGLSTQEANRRLQTFGPNSAIDVEESTWRLLWAKFLAPIPCLLEGAIVLQIILGEYIEASLITVLLIFNATLGFFQESRARATLEALRKRLALKTTALRDGAWTILSAEKLVPGDIIKLSLGSVVAADVRLKSGSVLLDQSMLTGESLPVEAGPGHDTYAGALIRRGEAVAEVTATGHATKFGKTAELVRTAHNASSQQQAIFRVVLYLAITNGIFAVALIGYSIFLKLPVEEILPLGLIAVLASVPVALPATFTLAAANSAQKLARTGVLPTRLSAVDEAATMNVLCVDKTGTLTQNELAIAKVVPFDGYDENSVLGLARLASSDGGLDPIDAAVRGSARPAPAGLRLERFTPFDPNTKMAQAMVLDSSGSQRTIIKGAFSYVAKASRCTPLATSEASKLENQGLRVLGVAEGPPGNMRLAGLLALSDPPRPDARECVRTLQQMGIHVVMVTGDAPETAATVARAVGLEGKVFAGRTIPDRIEPEDFAVFAGCLPEDKFTLVKAFQSAGHIVGMCGDGANDAPALRQAQFGIAVSTSTDVAKSAAGIVLTEPGLSGIVNAVTQGRIAFQRILTYTLRSILHKVRQVPYLGIGLFMTGHAILTPMLVVISMITGDFLAMSSTTDNVIPSPRPNIWKIGDLTLMGIMMGAFDLLFCVLILWIGHAKLHLPIETMQTLTLVNLVVSGQAIYYVVRERRHLWSSRPSKIVAACSIIDLTLVPSLAMTGTLMAPLPVPIIAGLFGVAAIFAFTLDGVKTVLLHHLTID
ncbi:MAG: HAD-IC family P-type ATPase [Afipia sp.]|nr:HAD-IC family P-type ATPase [Afipia sp.]